MGTGRETRRQTRARRGSGGFTVVAAVGLLTVVGVLALAFLSASLSSARQTQAHADATRLQSAAESALLAGVHGVWSGYLASSGGSAGSLASFRGYLDASGLTGGKHDLSAFAALPEDDASPVLAGAKVQGLWLERADDASSTELTFSAAVQSRVGEGTVEQPPKRALQATYVVEGGAWQGLEFALLANNVNCIMCHAQIDTSGRFYNLDSAKYGSFDRVKVGTLEKLLLRSNIGSFLAGTLYVRGSATHKDGTAITDWSAETLKGFAFDAAGKLLQDAWGDPTVVDLVPAGSPPDPLENLYLNYELDPLAMVDGYLPESFPAPFPDDGGGSGSGAGNRVVDASEFSATTSGFAGTLTGGSIYLADANAIDTSGELTTALTTGNQTSLPASTTGNLVLTGTASDPLVIDGDVAIDADVVLQGYVKGEGSLMVSGNVYIPSDLVYEDGTDASGNRTFGIAADGTENRLAIASGGSIVIGNMFYTKSAGGKKGGSSTAVTGYAAGAYNFVLSEIALFNRSEWMKTQPKLPASGQTLSAASTWTVTNPGYVPGYVPRYYNFTPGGTIPIFNRDGYFDGKSWIGSEHGSSWDTKNSYAYPGTPADGYLYNADGSPKAVVHSLAAEGGWISDAMLSKMMGDATASHAPGVPLQIDGLLYTNNSIFGIVGQSTPMKGEMIVNGAILAADVGLLVPGSGGIGLNLNYDPRCKPLLDIRSSEAVSLRRALFSVVAAP